MTESSFLNQQRHQQEDRYGNLYGDITVSGNARVFLGNHYGFSEDDKTHIQKALYYESMSTRRDQLALTKNTACDWVWSTHFAQWVVGDEKIFWIFGKPGSGKSKLISYMSACSDLRDKLPNDSTVWAVISFFFDFRLAGTTGNSLVGLLRSLLIQIVDCDQELAPIIKLDMSPDASISLIKLKHLFEKAITLSRYSYLLLIDGLDEYDGATRDLLDFLRFFRAQKKTKLCFASRPEPMIQAQLRDVPQLCITDYNSESIRSHIESCLQQIQADQDVSLPTAMITTIHDRANGVFLWADLVIGEMLDLCVAGGTPAEIMKVLEDIPSELAGLYERILSKLPNSRKVEAAILYTLIQYFPVGIPLNLLHDTILFLEQQLKLEIFPLDLHNVKLFETRLHATLGGLVEVVTGCEGLHPVEMPISRNVQPMHETVASYSTKSSWHTKLLPKSFREACPDYIWARIFSQALVVADAKIYGSLGPAFADRNNPKTREDFENVLRLPGVDPVLQRWTTLLFYSITYIPFHALQILSYEDRGLATFLEYALRSRLASHHFVLSEIHFAPIAVPHGSCLEAHMSDLTLAAAHGGHHYLNSKEERIMLLDDNERHELVMVLIPNRDEDKFCPLIGYADRMTHETLRTVDMVLWHDKQISSFSLGIYLRLEFDWFPHFLACDLQNPPDVSEAVELPPWIGQGVKHLFEPEPPLFIWACGYGAGNYQDLEHQLAVILYLGVDIYGASRSGRSVVHYLVTECVNGHSILEHRGVTTVVGGGHHHDLGVPVEKLYALEKAHANFEAQFEGRTPLHAFRHGLATVLSGIPHKFGNRLKDTPNLFFSPVARKRLCQIDFMLAHKERTGHLPQPMSGREDDSEQSLLRRRCDLCSDMSTQVLQFGDIETHI